MIDSSMGNVLNRYLEALLIKQDAEIKGLLGERDAAYATIGKKDEHIEALMVHINHLTKSIDALADDKVKLQNEVGAYKANYQPLNALVDLLEEDLNESELEVLALKEQRTMNHERMDKKDLRIRELENMVVALDDDICGAERFIKRQEDSLIAMAIQAAEAEDRADNERRGRLQLVMRL